MIIDYKPSHVSGKTPENEGQLLEYATLLLDDLWLWHRESCNEMTKKESLAWERANKFKEKFYTVVLARNEAIAIAQIGGHWNPRIPDHVSGGIINWPPTLNRNNKGSEFSFLHGVGKKLGNKDLDNIDVIAIHNALYEAEVGMKSSTFWDASHEDIVDG